MSDSSDPPAPFVVHTSMFKWLYHSVYNRLNHIYQCILFDRTGEGGIGVSNSLGANSLAILMSLGLPWLIRNIIHRNEPDRSYIALDSADIEYTILSLLLATVVLYAVISYAKYNLKRSVGVTLICVYLVFITLCILLEMNILIPTGGCRWTGHEMNLP